MTGKDNCRQPAKIIDAQQLKNKYNEIIGVLGISIEITERKKLEEALRKAKEVAEIANQAKTLFIANMSHDIRTPLTGVIGLSEMLESTLQNPEQKEEAHIVNSDLKARIDGAGFTR